VSGSGFPRAAWLAPPVASVFFINASVHDRQRLMRCQAGESCARPSVAPASPDTEAITVRQGVRSRLRPRGPWGHCAAVRPRGGRRVNARYAIKCRDRLSACAPLHLPIMLCAASSDKSWRRTLYGVTESASAGRGQAPDPSSATPRARVDHWPDRRPDSLGPGFVTPCPFGSRPLDDSCFTPGEERCSVHPRAVL
jgi:hypothetical protein